MTVVAITTANILISIIATIIMNTTNCMAMTVNTTIVLVKTTLLYGSFHK